MLTIPLQASPNQQTKVVLDNQNCQIAVYQKGEYLFVDINVNGTNIFIGALARNVVLLNPCRYAAFEGDLMFIDTQGTQDPQASGLGSRYQLLYVTEVERVLIVSKS